MTLSTWKTEFYPTEASECSKEDAIEHSLRKWRGLRKEALERHEVFALGGDVVDAKDNCFSVDASNCALCERFYEQPEDSYCTACPLAISRGGKACVDQTGSEASSPWVEWTRYENPEPMISALEKAQKEQS